MKTGSIAISLPLGALVGSHHQIRMPAEDAKTTKMMTLTFGVWVQVYGYHFFDC